MTSFKNNLFIIDTSINNKYYTVIKFILYILIYSVMLASGIQQSDSDIYIYIYVIYIFFFIFFSIMVYYRLLNIVPYAIQ